MKKTIYITPEVQEAINVKKLGLSPKATLSKNPIEFFLKIKNKPKEIHIYDLGFNKTNTIIPIINHINKTGINPLRKQEKKIKFYDITQIYKQQKGGEIAECYGGRPQKQKNKKYIQAHFLCNYVIAANHIGIKNIYAYVID